MEFGFFTKDQADNLDTTARGAKAAAPAAAAAGSGKPTGVRQVHTHLSSPDGPTDYATSVGGGAALMAYPRNASDAGKLDVGSTESAFRCSNLILSLVGENLHHIIVL